MRAKNVLICLIGFLLLIPLLAATSYATVEVTCFSKDYTRNKGKPVTITDTFISALSSARLIVTNGDPNDPSVKRVTAAKIQLNGNEICVPKDFSDTVSEIIINVDLIVGNNTINVLVKDPKGGTFTLQLVHDVEAAGTIGPGGGLFSVEDPASELFGTEVEFLDGSVDEDADFLISEAPDDFFPPAQILSPIINLSCSKPLKNYVFVTMPLNILITEYEYLVITYFDNISNKFGYIPPIGYNSENNTITFETNHFTIFFVESAKDKIDELPPLGPTNFILERDRFNKNVVHAKPYFEKFGINLKDKGICLAFTNYSLWYFINKFKTGEQSIGLNCLWDEQKSVYALKAAYERMPIIASIDVWGEKFKHLFKTKAGKIFYIMDEISSKGRPVALDLLPGETTTINHSILVYKYEKLNAYEIKFTVYDPNYPRIEQYLVVNTDSFAITYFIDYSYDDNFNDTINLDDIRPFYIGDSINDEYKDIFNILPADNWCDLDLDDDLILDGNDNCLYLPNSSQSDIDNDQIGDDCDNCIENPNCFQFDTDEDGSGTICDCNDSDPDIHPDAEEICGDGIDQDCDGNDTSCEPNLPSPPTSLSATYDSTNNWNHITWNASPGATSYNLYWGTEAGVTKESEHGGNTLNTEFTHTGVELGWTYYYRVSAVNSAGESDLSEEVSAEVRNFYPHTVIDTISVGNSPWWLEVTPDGSRVYVANADDDTVSVIRTSDNTVIDTISDGMYGRPLGIAITPDGSYAYITKFNDTSISVIQTSDNTLIDTIPVGIGAMGVAITPDGSMVYAATFNTVSVIRTSDNTVLDTIPVVISSYHRLLITPDGSRVYVTNDDDNTVSVIRTSDNTVIDTISVGMDSRPYGVVVTPDGSRVYVLGARDETVSVIRTSDNTVIDTISVDSVSATHADWGIAVSPSGRYVYVGVGDDRAIWVIRTSDNAVIDKISLGNVPLDVSAASDGSRIYVGVGDSTVSVIGF